MASKTASLIERHRSFRAGWLRAAVLGANDGIISTASLIIGVAAANGETKSIIVAGSAGLVSGALSMAAGEYVSVSSQADSEKSDLILEGKELKENPSSELEELTEIYVKRGLDGALAKKVASKLMERDALGAHARDELGMSEFSIAKPLIAALASAASFAIGASLPLLLALFTNAASTIPIIFASSLVALTLLGALAAQIGGSSMKRGALRVSFWGALAMVLTLLIGRLFGSSF